MKEFIVKPGEEVTILTPFNTSIKDIKIDATQTADCIHNISTYPNGVVLESFLYADRIIYKTNKEFIDNGDGTISISL